MRLCSRGIHGQDAWREDRRLPLVDLRISMSAEGEVENINDYLFLEQSVC